jgi:hypothetical protein
MDAVNCKVSEQCGKIRAATRVGQRQAKKGKQKLAGVNFFFIFSPNLKHILNLTRI